jgi:hypothetical protein
VLAFCLVEMALCFLDFNIFNNDGHRNVSLMMASLFVGSARAAVSRVLVIAVAMGYGVVRYITRHRTTQPFLC